MKISIIAAITALAVLSGCGNAPEAPVNATEPEITVPSNGVQEGDVGTEQVVK
jgi:PBP1b-binding outer membrane lipoprotein LpoB